MRVPGGDRRKIVFVDCKYLLNDSRSVICFVKYL